MISATKGKMQDYISNVDFSLNFEDRTSVKVKIGGIVRYDGITASYKKSTGEEYTGKTTSLQSAISRNWLTLNVKGAVPSGPVNANVEYVRNGATLKNSENIPVQDSKYSGLTGGNFETFLHNDQGTKVITENDRVVKRSKTIGDQVSVKAVSETSTVTSSTATPPTMKPYSKTIMRSDDYNAESSTPRKTKTASAEQKKAQTFTVDDTTPRVSEDSTLKEVNNVTRPLVKDAESQDAKVVKKISKPRIIETESEGVVLKSSVGSSDKEIDFSVKVSSGSTMEQEATIKVSSGSTPIADLSSVDTQEGAEKATSDGEKSQYLDLLPKNWSELHWVRKEQFIKQQTDKEFIKFILMVDTVKAVQNACRKRLLEIEKLNMQK